MHFEMRLDLPKPSVPKDRVGLLNFEIEDVERVHLQGNWIDSRNWRFRSYGHDGDGNRMKKIRKKNKIEAGVEGAGTVDNQGFVLKVDDHDEGHKIKRRN
ncbi:hypothetical protein U1Q18_016886 [Sarracenia purpurea var. burkii]